MDELTAQVATEVGERLALWHALLDTAQGGSEQVGVPALVEELAPRWAQVLRGDDQVRAREVATALVGVLFPAEAPIPDPWWSTPLGRAVVAAIGHPRVEVVSYALAGAMLGVSKGRADQLAREGKLERAPRGGVVARSVRERVRGSRG